MAGEELLPKGAERWALFSHDELGWLALGLNVAEGEGLLPPAGDGGELGAEAFVAFQEGLDAAAEAGR